ncbi:MAG TPA: ATP-binding protein [Candidatus Cloacimonadota bacterium]|nr:ATP-binding protein [Candidatus Cloacimonadota bacterium]
MKFFRHLFKNLLIFILLDAAVFLGLHYFHLPADAFIILFVIITLLFIFIVYFYLKNQLQPLAKINSQIQHLVDRNFSILPEIEHRDFHQAFRNLNEITHRLQVYQEKLSKQKEGFNIIIESIKESIWIQNEKGLIRSFNSGFAKLIGRQDLKNEYFWNVIEQPELYEIADKNFKNPASRTEKIGFANQHFLCSSSYSPFTKETVFILYDITEFRQLETIKKDFILNVSHELRTPLTSIKGYLETFENDLTGEQKNYVEIIRRNTDRLIHIVNDLLTLSRLEHVRELEIENIVIADFLKNIANIFNYRLNDKKLKLEIDLSNPTDYFQADRYQFEQVFINLIDNAIKYTDAGTIRIEVKSTAEAVKFDISDSGCGIAQQHLPRLFERFYLVDKSRSRKMGGTGLGLSIVKHIVNLHDGTINVSSKVGSGTQFSIVIPRK